jgi:hypothetical protein
MFNRIALSMIFAFGFVGTAAAQTWNAEQKEIWNLEELQWKMAAAEDMSWIDTMVHPNLKYWETGDPMPRGRESLKRWGKYAADNSAVLEQELFPISITVTGNYTDVLVKENGRWLFLTWSGGDQPKK